MLGLLVNRWVLGSLAAVLLFGGVYWKGRQAGKEVVQDEWDKAKLVQEQARIEWERKVRKTEKELQAKLDTVVKEKQHELQILKRNHADIVASLRNRNSRPADFKLPSTSRNAESSGNCSGAELFREDAEFLIGEAARADEIRTELEACYVMYDSIKKANN
jgi:hypothetical protein